MTIKVYVRHIREAKFCTSGGRTWFADHGFDWNDFVTNGIEVERLEATGDEMALVVSRLARKEADDGIGR